MRVPQELSSPAKLCSMRHLLMEHRNGLIVDMELTQVDSYAERGAAIEEARPAPRRTAALRRRRRQRL
jgi:hypothetical protein